MVHNKKQINQNLCAERKRERDSNELQKWFPIFFLMHANQISSERVLEIPGSCVCNWKARSSHMLLPFLSSRQTHSCVCVRVCVRERSLQRKCRLNKGEKIRQQREMPNKRTSSQANNKICVFSCRHPFHCFALLLLLLLLLFLYLAYYSILICLAFLFGNL